ncbi:helix-turn-helix transcriptional regulator [Pantoea agglomerans]|uniref:Helix-turn-helix transcriptional regulator n=2 Tax=Enterobacter agglomerans TaxID=549 RepID=A0ACC5RGW3_ENTAG|nr:helix-turn-helix transcriptional regulator [Pantoea agglomerans]
MVKLSRPEELLKAANVTKAGLARLAEVSPQAVNNWFKRGEIGKTAAIKIAASTGLSLSWILGEDNGSDSIEVVGGARDGVIPVIGDAVLGMDGLIDMMEFHAGWLQIYSSDNRAYGVRVRGDSMWPRIQSGEFVVIEPNTKVHPGDEVFIRTADGHNMIKILNFTRDGDYQFTSINNDHKPITMPPSNVVKIHFVSGIIKATRFISAEDVSKD